MVQKIKLILIGLTGLSLLFTVIGLIMPSSVKISRGIIVSADSAMVTQKIMDMRSWQTWMTWLQSDDGSLVRIEESGDTRSMIWNHLGGKQSGKISLYGVDDDLIRMQFTFPGMNKAEGGIHVRGTNQHQTEILWMIEYPLRWYPWERFEGIFLDALIGRQLEDSLKKLQTVMGHTQNLF